MSASSRVVSGGQPRMLTARAMTSAMAATETADWSIIMSFAQRVTGVGAALAVDVVQVLRAGVPGLEVGVGQGPGRRDAVHVLDLPEVALTETEQDRPVDLGVAA